MADEDAERLEPLLRGGRWLAASSWLREYRSDWLRSDRVADITLAAYLLTAGIVEARGAVRDILRAEGLEEGVGEISRHLSLDAVLAEPRQ